MARIFTLGVATASLLAVSAAGAAALLPTGVAITPEALPGARFERLDPKLAAFPDFRAGQPVAIRLSPDGTTLLVLTSGFNRILDAQAQPIPAGSTEYVFVYDVTGGYPRQLQALPLPNTFQGLAWAPDSRHFVASGGVDDKIYAFTFGAAGFTPDGEAVALGHEHGVGPNVRPMVAGLAVSPDGQRVLAANFENESVSLIDLAGRKVLSELDLRPGKLDSKQRGVPGGEFPVAVVWGAAGTAFVASQRDREIEEIAIDDTRLRVVRRLKLAGAPTALLLDKSGRRLFAAEDGSDTVAMIDTAAGKVVDNIAVTAPTDVFANSHGWKGVNPNGLALSPDGRALFVTDGGINAVAVVQFGTALPQHGDGKIVALLPTGWYPTGVAIGADGKFLYAINAKSDPGPNPGGCRDTLKTSKEDLNPCRSHNQYGWQLEKGGLLSAPLPPGANLQPDSPPLAGPASVFDLMNKYNEINMLTQQVAANDHFEATDERRKADAVMAAVRRTVKHVIYIVKENRTYDQVLGDLDRGNGDPALAVLGGTLTPNHHALARAFVTADNFYDAGESSNVGWNWVTAAHTSDYVEKNAPVNYAGRGLTYDAEGTNRGIAVGYARTADRRRIDPRVADDDDILPGTADIAAPDGAAGAASVRYLWDGALQAGLSLRNYGFFPADGATDPHNPQALKKSDHPFAEHAIQFVPALPRLARYSDPYFRSFDVTYPDFRRVGEWRREFDGYVKTGKLPALTLLRLPNDHFGDFAHAPPGFDTVAGQMSDNDYALGLVVDAVAHSPYADSTVIIAVEDDSQDGPDHVDSHRSLLIAAGAMVRRGAVVSEYGNSIGVVRTVEDLLGIKPLGLNDGLALPLSWLFDPGLRTPWTYTAILPDALAALDLPVPPKHPPLRHADAGCLVPVARSAAWWSAATAGQDFSSEDRLDTPRFNTALWTGLRGDGAAAPPLPDGRDLRTGRDVLLAEICRAG
jgi:DNA-binding beta-propeller fold protein YncE